MNLEYGVESKLYFSQLGFPVCLEAIQLAR